MWDHKRLRRSVGHTPLECALFDAFCAAGGLVDAARLTTPEPAPLYTWWGYRHPQAYAQGKGWRVDHALITEALAARLTACTVFDEPRAWERPSDHAPVVLDLA